MTDKKTNHPITVAPHAGTVRVRVGGVTVAESQSALVLTEAGYPPVVYVPRTDVRGECCAPSARTSHCPYKGDASYVHLTAGGLYRPDAAWSYAAPLPAVAAIAGCLAFYPDRVDAIEIA